MASRPPTNTRWGYPDAREPDRTCHADTLGNESRGAGRLRVCRAARRAAAQLCVASAASVATGTIPSALAAIAASTVTSASAWSFVTAMYSAA
jgi:hypothetical protein